jgi:glutamine amidotransferase
MLNLIKCGIGNIGSIRNALNSIGCSPNIVEHPSQINYDFKKIILPGVGSFDSFIIGLKKNGLFDEIKKLVLKNKYKILGICVGMQSFFTDSEEGIEKGLNIIEGNLVKLNNSNNYKVPHMGWNNIEILNSESLLNNLPESKFYFAHSYIVKNINNDKILSLTRHSEKFPSSIKYQNIYGVQFHPEKSFNQGQKILKNFIDLC